MKVVAHPSTGDEGAAAPTRPPNVRAPRKRGSTLRYYATYAVTLLLGVLALAFVVSVGDDTEAAPQAPVFGAVVGDATGCFGDRVGFVQSGVFLDLHRVATTSDELGQRIGGVRLDGSDGRGTLEAVCPAGTPLAGSAFLLDLRVDEASASVVGTAQIDGRNIPVTISGVEALGSSGSSTKLTGSQLTGRMCLAVAIVIIAARGAGMVFSRIRQPRVVGEIVSGIVLGPSVVGAFFPEVTAYLFPPGVTSVLKSLADLGLILFMFLIGLELDHRLMKGSGRTALIVSHVSIVVPFAMGVLLALWLYPLLGTDNMLGFALFIGAVMAITAFPVLARILTDTGIHRTRLGVLAITCAAVGDLTAWCILAVVVAVVTSGGAAGALPTIGLAALYVLVMIFGVRPVIVRLAVVHEARGRLGPSIMSAIIVGLLVSSWITEEIGIHAIFGAFLLGAVMPRSPRLIAEITDKLEDVTVLLLLPIFFAVMGLSTRFDLLTGTELWLAAVFVIAVAVVGKWGGSMLAARVAGEGWRHSTALGILMNARGLTEIVVLTIGRDLGIISPALFTIMVLMALVTTFMATPLLSIVYPRRTVDWELYRDSAATRELRRAGVQRVLVALEGSDQDERLLGVAGALRGPAGRRPELVLAQVARPPGREEVRGRLTALDDAVAEAAHRLEPARARLAAGGSDVRVRTATGLDVGAEVARLAREEGADLVLLGWHQAYFGRNVLKGVPGELLREAAQDVAVLVDDEDRTSPVQGPVAVWYNGPVTGGAALDSAVDLARGMNASLLVAHDLHVERVDLSASGVDVEWLEVDGPDLEALQPRFSGARLVVIGDFQGSTRRISRREQLVRAMTCPVLVVHGARSPIARPLPPGPETAAVQVAT